MTLSPAMVAIFLLHASAGPSEPVSRTSPTGIAMVGPERWDGGPQQVPVPSATPDRTATGATPASPPPEQVAIAAGIDQQQDIVVSARVHSEPGDPFAKVNAKSFAVTQKVDEAVTGPLALAYKRGLPKPARDGVRNFLGNLHEPVVFANYLLQLKPGKAAETMGRFAINSTIGGAGLFDIAKRCPFRLPRRPNGFADTMGYYGVKPGPYFFLPLLGPTTLRDFLGGGVDRLVLPVAGVGLFRSWAYKAPAGVLRALDRRAEFDETLHHLRDDTVDPYVARRTLYLQRRQAEIDALHGRPHAVADGARAFAGPASPGLDLPAPSKPASPLAESGRMKPESTPP